MKVSAAVALVSAAPPTGPSCAAKGFGGAGASSGRACLSEQSVSLARAASSSSSSPSRAAPLLCPSALMDMRGCYSRLAALVPTLPRHRRVSKVELLQHVIDYIWDLQLELQHPLGAAAGAPRPEDLAGGAPEAACVNPDDRILCR